MAGFYLAAEKHLVIPSATRRTVYELLNPYQVDGSYSKTPHHSIPHGSCDVVEL